MTHSYDKWFLILVSVSVTDFNPTGETRWYQAPETMLSLFPWPFQRWSLLTLGEIWQVNFDLVWFFLGKSWQFWTPKVFWTYNILVFCWEAEWSRGWTRWDPKLYVLGSNHGHFGCTDSPRVWGKILAASRATSTKWTARYEARSAVLFAIAVLLLLLGWVSWSDIFCRCSAGIACRKEWKWSWAKDASPSKPSCLSQAFLQAAMVCGLTYFHCIHTNTCCIGFIMCFAGSKETEIAWSSRNSQNAVEAARPMESHASVPWEETTLGPWGVASQPYWCGGLC